MTATGATTSNGRLPNLALNGAAGFWLAMALIGQWAFFGYIALFYGPNLASGHYEAWGALSRMGARAYVPGDTAGNLTFGFHALAAGIVAFGGALQLILPIRARFPVFHRWNGRVFLFTVTGLSLSGFWLVWVRQSSPDTLSAICTTINGLLILTFGALAWRTATRRDFAAHRRWAMRLYLVSNAQWFLRIGFFGFMVLDMGLGLKLKPGLFFMLWTPGCFLVPLSVLELYLRAKARGGSAARLAIAGGLVTLTLLMTVGIAVYTLFAFKLATGGAAGLPG